MIVSIIDDFKSPWTALRELEHSMAKHIAPDITNICIAFFPLISQQKLMLWVLIASILLRHFQL